jgi:ATP-dependent DNA helicase RecQ
VAGAAEATLESALERLGYAEFRAGQREAIETLLAVRRLLLVAPTGGGKSLCYQLPATLLEGTSLVVSPLIALMHDQVEALGARGVEATYLASTLAPDETRRRLAGLSRGAYRMVYVAPERLVLPAFRSLLKDLSVPLVAIDEAHCISEWGHDFRPEYLELGALLAELPDARVVACTATATPLVRDEILARLGLPPDTPQLVRGFARPNLALRARPVFGRRDRERLVDAALAEALGAPGAGRGAAIVYAPTRRSAELEAERLRAAGWRAAPYHAGLSAEERDSAQRRFTARELEVVAATNAFGMGIDRADVRAVLHLAPPASLEAYYQEVGRAGRDGAPALGLLLVSPDDPPRRRHLIQTDAAGSALPEELVEHKWGMYLELLRWAEGGSCRHDAILRYFGDEAETLAGCGRCDVCQTLEQAGPDEAATAETVRKALSGVARVHRRFGLRAAVKLLRGESDERLARAGLDSVSTFGVLRDEPEAWLLQLVQRCVTAGWVTFEGDERPVVALTESGREVMKGSRPARLVLPSRESVRASGGRRVRVAADGAAAGTPASAREEALFEALRTRRQEIARRLGVPAYVVAHDRTLRDLARLEPRTPADVALAWGMGPSKLERFAAELLEAVASIGR